jgi:hypothetical protein
MSSCCRHRFTHLPHNDRTGPNFIPEARGIYTFISAVLSYLPAGASFEACREGSTCPEMKTRRRSSSPRVTPYRKTQSGTLLLQLAASVSRGSRLSRVRDRADGIFGPRGPSRVQTKSKG